jgi:tetraacyldisaccharide 4'-kinase
MIIVGNLSVGGTGKSPMVEYLIALLKNDFSVAALSRGYKRKTKGYVLAEEGTTALEIGDEPMQFHLKYPDISIAVGEERIVAVPQLLHDKPETEVIILDDAFQHRSIKAGLNILLSEYSNLFMHDFFLPTGDLRDQRSSYKRAEVIVVTKCPDDLSVEEKNEIIKDIQPLEHQRIFFTSIEYGTPYHIITKQTRSITTKDEILLVCGIANPKPLQDFLLENANTYYMQAYSDHHIFTIDDLKDIEKRFKEIDSDNKFIVTTEKDAVRLFKFREQLVKLPLYVLPIKHKFLFEEEEAFNLLVTDFVKHFNRS